MKGSAATVIDEQGGNIHHEIRKKRRNMYFIGSMA